MTFKQFRKWCNDRACDGRWGPQDAEFCIELMCNMMKIPWWKRKKVWKNIEIRVLYSVVAPINKKIQHECEEVTHSKSYFDDSDFDDSELSGLGF